MTFEALSWPTEQDLADDAGDLYRGSAQLFVGELLRLPDGRACLQAMLARLPQHHNWQFAFLEAFHTHFQRPLDVEKWWALSLAQASGRDAAQAWPLAESWQKLDQAIHAAVQVRTRTNELPLRAEVSLQTIIREWDPVAADPGAQATRCASWGCSARASPRSTPGWCRTTARRSKRICSNAIAAPPTSPYQASGPGRAAEAAIQQLDALDARRMALRPGPTPAPASPSPALPSPAP